MKAEKNSKNNRRNIVMEIKKRMLKWPSPVEYVNNLYGCHPLGAREYFEEVFGDVKRKMDTSIPEMEKTS